MIDAERLSGSVWLPPWVRHQHAARLHQLRKRFTAPGERLAWHEPRRWDDRVAPEILLAICHR